MTTDTFTFDNIAGQTATLEVNHLDTHLEVTWGKLTIIDTFGQVGFWSVFNRTSGSWAKGAAHAAALRKFARETIESEIYAHLRALQEQAADCGC